MSQTAYPGSNLQVTTGGVAVQVVPAQVSGGYIVNPLSSTDQGLGAVEVLLIDVVGTCGGTSLPQANGTIVALQPGQTFTILPNLTSSIYVNAYSSGHKFTAVYTVASS